MTRACEKCGLDLPPELTRREPKRRVCAECKRQRKRQATADWYARHPDYKANWRAEHPGSSQRYVAKWRAQHPELRKDYAPRACEFCAASYKPHRVDQRFCSRQCSRKYHAAKNHREHPEPWNDRRRANYQKRRALKKGASKLLAQKIVLDDVRTRDKNRCGLCAKQVNGKPWPHPLSASLDHIVPLSAGGAHVMANVQLAHLRCNLEKGPRARDEQLRLV